MHLRFPIYFMMMLVFSGLNTTYACDTEDLTSIHEEAGLTFVKRYAPDTLPLSFFEELANHGKTTREDITYSVMDQSVIQAKLPTNLPISDGLLGHRENLEIKRLTTTPRTIEGDPSKLALEYAYKGRWFSGEQKFAFYAHFQDPLDEKFVQQWTTTLQGFTIHYQEDNTLIATLLLEGKEEEIEPSSLLKQVTTAAQFVAPYVLNDVAQSLAPKLVSSEALVVLNALSAKSGYDTPLHALLSQDETQETEVDPLDQKRKELAKTSEAIGATLALVPGATKVRTAINLACQYGGYDSLTHLIKGVPSKSKGNTTEEDSYQRKIDFAKGAARLAILMVVPGAKFIVIGSKIYEFVAGESITQTVVEKVTNSPQTDKN
ncbi:hypothetical protein IM40_07180 [Candidatus Paracaedimonas acanthamoebae]|nr:hypothetical protein IM40_07180 [Candidatus Paracaedimonas acanthamoebae]